MNMNMSFIYGECHENVNIYTCWTVLDAKRVVFSNISVGKSVSLTFFLLYSNRYHERTQQYSVLIAFKIYLLTLITKIINEILIRQDPIRGWEGKKSNT